MPEAPATLERMNPKKPKSVKKDRHKVKPLQLRLVDEMRAALDKLAKLHGTNASTEARIGIRKLLESEGLWPPKSE